MKAQLNLAQSSNFWTPTVMGYDLWRRRSLSLMTGEPFSLEKEFRQFLEWVGPVTGQQWLDVGTSTGNYAKLLVQAGAAVTALDLSAGHLKRLPRHPRLHALQGNMEEELFASGSFDGVVIAGTLNETFSPEQMLLKAGQVLKEKGVLYLMYLLPSQHLAGQRLQSLISRSGIHFLESQTIERYLRLHNMALEKQKRHAIVCFELYRKAGGV
ncbi:class I SAM-dependent methyltransferase [Deinococcus cellulosilyticus]|nr:class I SAM-dependent methyltransferase [Deinococcus cellulosilyticus]